jgi:hypothetical protein
LRQPVETRVGANARFSVAMLDTTAAQEDFRIPLPDFRLACSVTDRTAAAGTLKESPSFRSGGEQFHQLLGG